MARYQINLAYDGTEFQGFQRQGKKRTVQVEIENALRKLSWDGKAIISAGRTDTGVHAAGQVVAFDLDWQHSASDLKNALNANLPPDISIVQVEQSNESFHPRFDALARCYRYNIFQQLERNPLKERYAWRIEQLVKPKLLDRAAKALIGLHDFGEFGRAMQPGKTTVRTVFEANWKEKIDGGLEFEVVADAFLYHMVRRMVYLQVLVGRNRLDLHEYKEAIRTKKKVTPGMAPPNGLCLVKVFYNQEWQDDWKIEMDVENKFSSSKQLM
jgi:tRNA pseudouridine38-40 synthase